ncbi:MAG: folate family ECF transporter S component [Candidatus Phytoplasma sp.]|nr:folate family ECF transporter S component [Phytoplasma sp.]
MKKSLKYVTLTAILTAISVVLDVLSKMIIPGNGTFGTPLFALPLIIISIFINPIYGLMAGIISDYVGFMLNPQGNYAVIFALSAAMWGFLPGIISRYKSKWYLITLGILIAHVFATSANTLALWIEVGKLAATKMLKIRVSLIPVNVIVLSYLTILINQRMHPIYETFIEG